MRRRKLKEAMTCRRRLKTGGGGPERCKQKREEEIEENKRKQEADRERIIKMSEARERAEQRAKIDEMNEEITLAEMARRGTRRSREEEESGGMQEQGMRDKRIRTEVDPPDTGGAAGSGRGGGEKVRDADGDISMGALCSMTESVRERSPGRCSGGVLPAPCDGAGESHGDDPRVRPGPEGRESSWSELGLQQRRAQTRSKGASRWAGTEAAHCLA